MGDGHVCRWDLPADEPFADVFDADEDTNGAPVHGEILDGIYILSRESLVCGEGWEEECEPGAGGARVNTGGNSKKRVAGVPYEVED